MRNHAVAAVTASLQARAIHRVLDDAVGYQSDRRLLLGEVDLLSLSGTSGCSAIMMAEVAIMPANGSVRKRKSWGQVSRSPGGQGASHSRLSAAPLGVDYTSLLLTNSRVTPAKVCVIGRAIEWLPRVLCEIETQLSTCRP